ncbi:MAG: amidohydrolase [Clostridia bacterium]|nr:amidohydrolase [Clostridia bacterium]
MKKADVMIKNAYIITMDKDRNIISNGCIVIDKDKITTVGGGELASCYEASRVVDAKGKFVFPGMISTHSHLFQTMLKGLGRDKLLFDWLDSSVRTALHRFDGEMCYYAALTGCMEAIQSGTTTILDYMYCHTSPGLSDYVTQAMEDIGIRGIYGRGFTNTANFPPEFKVAHHDTEQDMFDDVRRLYRKYQGHSRMSVALAPGIIWDNTDDGYREMRKMANEMHIPLTMHVLESEDDDKYCTQVRGGRTIPHLERLGFIGPDFIAVHCVCMEEEDFDIFKQYDVKVSHNPVSNMILASGVAPVERMVREGLTVSLACDSSASNDTQDMMEVLKTTALLQKVHLKDAAAMPASKVLELATLGGAKAVMREGDLGAIAPGMKADLVIYDPFHGRSIPVHDPVSAIVYSSGQVNIESVMVDGVFVMEQKHMTMIDEEKVLYATQKAAEKLISEVGLGNTQWGRKIGNLGL